MINVIYPKGSIISTNDDNRFCIVNIKDDSYGCVFYPYGLFDSQNIVDVKFAEVKKVYFWGYKNKKYEDRLKKMIISSMLKDDK